MRHYVRLSQKNYAIDSGIYPLGSCTMKHNPRLNEKMARLPGFGDIHPFQPVSTVPGAVEAWAAVLAAHGRFGLDRVLAPAIRLAERHHRIGSKHDQRADLRGARGQDLVRKP